ncbi:MAG: MFS transporter [Burkholderiaceae bacterium]|nr:MFS transporter [Burkholderiaceae bacterium]
MTGPAPSAPAPALWLRLFLPFAAGYLLSYLFRTSNAVVGPVLAAETFAAAQIPLGLLLDRFGPRRVEALLLLFAAAGAAVFAQADGLAGLAWGRALIGVGVSACLMAALTAFSRAFPPERQASLIGWVMSAGGLGAVFAAAPLEAAIGLAGWRGVMFALAVATVAVAAAIGFLVPERAQPAHPTRLAEQLAGVRQVMGSRAFWRYAPMFTLTVGGFMAVQGLWAARWLAEVEGLDRAAVARQLTLLNAGFLGGCLFMGFMTTALIRRGIAEARILALAAGAFVLVFAAINAAAGSAPGGLWVLLAFIYPLCNIAFAIVGRSLPLALAGRANTALNLVGFVGAFALQWGMGLVVDALRAAGWDGAAAYRATFGGLLALQAASVAWMFVSRGAGGARPAR